MADGDGTIVTLVSQEGTTFSVPICVVRHSTLISTMLEDDGGEDGEVTEIPLPYIKAAIMSKVTEFFQLYEDEPFPEIPKPLPSTNMADAVPERYATFVDGMDKETQFELILAANYLDVQPLLELLCAKVASTVKGKTPEQIRAQFGLQDDFTAEERHMLAEE